MRAAQRHAQARKRMLGWVEIVVVAVSHRFVRLDAVPLDGILIPAFVDSRSRRRG
jgi:hypothetical protein